MIHSLRDCAPQRCSLLRHQGRSPTRLNAISLKATVANGFWAKLWHQLALPVEVPIGEGATKGHAELGWRTDFAEVYTLQELIGSGAFGQVHVGVHKQSREQFAIKTMTKVRGKLRREETLNKISKEATMMQRTQDCPGVVRLLECFEDEDSAYLVTELCRGGDLRQYVETYGPLREDMLALVAYEVLKIVQGCHHQGILYSDVKPANFCLLEATSPAGSQPSVSGKLRAVDFGCSQLLGSVRLSRRTGTVAFMAPEVFAQDFGPKADVWSTGVMLYWLCSHRLPYWKDSEVPALTNIEVISDIVSSAPITFDYGPWLHMSPEGVDFVRGCLTRPEDMRLGVEQALQHPWLRRHVGEEQVQRLSS